MTHQVLCIHVYTYTMKQYQPSIQRPIQFPPVHHSIYLMRLLYRHFHPSRHTFVTIPRLLPLHPTIYPIVPHFDDPTLLPSKEKIDCRGITFLNLSERGANMDSKLIGYIYVCCDCEFIIAKSVVHHLYTQTE